MGWFTEKIKDAVNPGECPCGCGGEPQFCGSHMEGDRTGRTTADKYHGWTKDLKKKQREEAGGWFW